MLTKKKKNLAGYGGSLPAFLSQLRARNKKNYWLEEELAQPCSSSIQFSPNLTPQEWVF